MKRPFIIVQLIHIHGPRKGEIQEFSEDCVVVGRHPSSTVLFPADETSISRKHAEIRRDGNQFKLIDCSRNGTFVNGKKITEYSLRDGDVIEFAEGGPKVSFLTKIVEKTDADDGGPAVEKPPPTPPVVAAPEILPPEISIPENREPVETPPEVIVEIQPPPIRPALETPSPESIEKVAVPLIIQYGPTIRTYRELPIFMGKSAHCDFVLDHPDILDRHARIFFNQNRYWIQDLTGKKMIRVNNIPIDIQVALSPSDLFSLSPHGPRFSFLGEGRIMEASEPVEEDTEPKEENKAEASAAAPKTDKSSDGFWSRLKKKS